MTTSPQPTPRSMPPPPARTRQRQLLWLALAVVVIALLVRACAGHENKYEHLARELTQAVQTNDMAAVQKLENVGTAADMSRARLGAASDTLAPLGKIKRVKENTPSGDPPRVHEFDVTFDKGVVHEKIEFDPQDKVFHFRYDVTSRS